MRCGECGQEVQPSKPLTNHEFTTRLFGAPASVNEVHFDLAHGDMAVVGPWLESMGDRGIARQELTYVTFWRSRSGWMVVRFGGPVRP